MASQVANQCTTLMYKHDNQCDIYSGYYKLARLSLQGVTINSITSSAYIVFSTVLQVS